MDRFRDEHPDATRLGEGFLTVPLDLLFVASAAGEVRAANPRFDEVLGALSAPGAPTLIDRALAPDRAALADALRTVAAGGPRRSLVARVTAADGEARALDFSVGGAPAQRLVYGSARDVTAQRQREAMSERYQLLSRYTRDVVLFISPEGRVLEANDAAVAAYGYTRDELTGMSIHELRAPGTRAMVPEQMAQAFTRGILFETVHRRRDGSTFPVEVGSRSAVIGGVVMLISIIRDQTERSAMQARLMEADRMVSIGTLAASVAHEINNPLAYATANVDLLERELPRVLDELREGAGRDAGASPPVLDRLEGALEMARVAREGLGRVRAIVRDLRTLSRAEEDHREALDVRRVLDAAINLASGEIRHRAQLVKRFDDVPDVAASEARLGQVFVNLLANAAHAATHGRSAPMITVAVAREGAFVRVDVEDTGPGIAPEILPRIFEPFVTSKPAGEGTGLGLYISRSIVAALGGQITAENLPDGGARFCVKLPIADASTRPSSGVVPAPSGASAGPALTILVVDDEPHIGATVRAALTPPHRVDVAAGTSAALALLEAGARYDVVLCDVIMPGGDGLTLHAAVRARWPALAARFVFMTGGAPIAGVRDALASVANPVLEKPFDLAALLAALRAAAPPSNAAGRAG